MTEFGKIKTIMVLKYPVRNIDISQKFGEDNTNHPQRKSFYTLFDNKHPGVDFALPIATEVFSSYPGIVVRQEDHKGMGKTLGIRNGNIVILYGHLSEFHTQLGQVVKQNELIGLSGNSGKATTAPHLHFEMRDITKPTLLEMVFDPPFEKELENWKESFIYKINNENTSKTLEFLSTRYFGVKDYWEMIAEANPHLLKAPKKEISDNTEVTLPNYT